MGRLRKGVQYEKARRGISIWAGQVGSGRGGERASGPGKGEGEVGLTKNSWRVVGGGKHGRKGLKGARGCNWSKEEET